MKGSDTRNIRNGADAPRECADAHPGMCRLASSYCAVGITASYAASVVAMALLAAVVLSHTEGQRQGTRTQVVVRAIASTVREAPLQTPRKDDGSFEYDRSSIRCTVTSLAPVKAQRAVQSC